MFGRRGVQCRMFWMAAATFFGLATLLVAESGGAQQTPLPTADEQKAIMDWLTACNLNKDLGSVTCKEIEYCIGRKRVRKDEDPLIYELMRDSDRDGVVCEQWPAGSTVEGKPESSTEEIGGDVVFGLGIATGFTDERLGPREAVDAEGNLLAADFRGGETRPLATASYLFPAKDTARVRPGFMALLDADIVGEEGLVKPRGVGVGFTLAFRGTLGDNWTQAFGVGLAHMWESAELLRGDAEPVLVDRTVNSVVLVVTYSFGKRWWQ